MDIDIDFADRSKILNLLKHIPASIVDDNKIKKHNTGVYFHEIPVNPFTNTANIDYKIAEKRGYFKIDFLNFNLYKNIKSEEHLDQLMNIEPLWELLEIEEFTNMLHHISGHTDVLKLMKPKTIEQLAAVLAIIRPAKRYLIGQDWNIILEEVWKKPLNDEFYFKKSHSISYAVAIIVQMNLICQELNYAVV